ncbi:hypothetical protein AB0C29_41060 [Actinoplanes sp. NPDC048791]|uniref:hypothetical protein n=1 Tax=Actinoplanes sp. NPDC048791 TaxID=3154623 RepID=UPI003402A316
MDRRLLAVSTWLTVLVIGVSPPSRAASSTAARLDALAIATTGSLQEMRASEIVKHDRVETAIATCMRAAGHRYNKRPVLSFYRDFTEADFGYGTGHATVIDSLTEGPRILILNETAYARLARESADEPAVPPQDATALDKCRRKAGRRTYYQVEMPPGLDRVGLAFGELLMAVNRDPDIVRGMRHYRSCMHNRYGYVVDDRRDFMITSRLDRRDAPVDGAPASAAWRQAVAELERRFAADADCRRPAYEAGLRVIAELIDDWEARHRGEIAAVRAQWQQRTDDAARVRR